MVGQECIPNDDSKGTVSIKQLISTFLFYDQLYITGDSNSSSKSLK